MNFPSENIGETALLGQIPAGSLLEAAFCHFKALGPAIEFLFWDHWETPLLGQILVEESYCYLLEANFSELLGTFWESSESLLGASGSFLGAFWDPLGAFWEPSGSKSRSLLGVLLRAFWELLEAVWEPFQGPSGSLWEPFGSLLGTYLRAFWEPSGSNLGATALLTEPTSLLARVQGNAFYCRPSSGSAVWPSGLGACAMFRAMPYRERAPGLASIAKSRPAARRQSKPERLASV